ncbi:hypothetical protein [Actinomadura geliboluensis]|uniref:hypothetical protein n=1 Tax=Actinomadura geliboluensis TaxID=882440 RepID=UPI0036B427A3
MQRRLEGKSQMLTAVPDPSEGDRSGQASVSPSSIDEVNGARADRPEEVAA